jgi:Tol biopolymer transport system component
LMASRFDPEDPFSGSPFTLSDDIFLPSDLGSAQLFVSRNGTLAYLERGEAPAQPGVPLSVIDRSGNLRPLDVEPRRYLFPSVSRDGEQVAVTVFDPSGSQIFVYDLDGGSEIRQLTFEGQNGQPTWSGDGEWVVFASNRSGKIRLWVKRANGRGPAQPLTDPADGYVHELPAFTADGERLAFSNSEELGSTGDIRIMDFPDGEPELLIDGVGLPRGIAFSPDGNAMAYFSTESTRSTLFVEPYPKEEASVRRVSEDNVNTAWPVWSRDSSRLTYQDLDTGAFGTVDIDTSDLSIRNRNPSIGFEGNPTANGRHADSMPGEDQLLVSIEVEDSGDTQDTARRIVIVDNWIEEVRARSDQE